MAIGSKRESFYNALFMVALSMTLATDTSICERGFSLMNRLMSAKRNRMTFQVLQMLMKICSRGQAWRDPAKIPTLRILEKWRASRNRYDSEAMFQKQRLKEFYTDLFGASELLDIELATIDAIPVVAK
eukprot:SAG11_NODE_1488_length_4814_cov_5.777943_2_plen_129_part_00